jgi:hypothetical protein
LDEDDEDDVAVNLLSLISSTDPDGCGVAAAQLECVEGCNAEIVEDCEDILNPSGSGSGDDDCKDLDDDLIKCLEDCYEE